MAESKPLYQPWNEDEFRGDLNVQRMSHVQRWMYRALLQSAFFHSTRPYLPNNDEDLYVLAGCRDKKQWLANKEVVLKNFNPCQDGAMFEHTRLNCDWERIMNRREQMVKMGERSGSARRAKAEHTLNVGSTQAEQVSKEVSKRSKSKEETGSDAPLGQEDELSAKKDIEKACRQILGIKPYLPAGASSEISALVDAYGSSALVSDFEDWARLAQGTSAITSPISAYLRIADSRLSGTVVSQSSPGIQELLNAIADVAGTDIVFTTNQYAALKQMLDQYGHQDFMLAFKDFHSKLDDFTIKQAAKTWIGSGSQRIHILVRAREQQKERENVAEKLTQDGRQEAQDALARVQEQEKAKQAEEDPNDF